MCNKESGVEEIGSKFVRRLVFGLLFLIGLIPVAVAIYCISSGGGK